MYYNRKILDSFSQLIEKDGKLRWLFDFVKEHSELDFLIHKGKSKDFISIYRGLTCILSILPVTLPQRIYIDADKKYKNLLPSLYGERDIENIFKNEIEMLIFEMNHIRELDRYFQNRKEGYYQNNFSRKYGICGNANDDFVIIDKEAVIGHTNKMQKDTILDSYRYKYKELLKELSYQNPKRYGKNLERKSIGDQLDFLGLDREGNILLIEFKHGTSASGIYLSPIQIGMYIDIFSNYPKENLEYSVFELLKQKQKIGLINPDWPIPNCITNIIPVLVISEYNYRSTAQTIFNEVLKHLRSKLGPEFLHKLQTYNYTLKNGLSKW